MITPRLAAYWAQQRFPEMAVALLALLLTTLAVSVGAKVAPSAPAADAGGRQVAAGAALTPPIVEPRAGRQVAPSQLILGELQYLFKQAASGGPHPPAYGAARDQLHQLVSELGRLPDGGPAAQLAGDADLETSGSGSGSSYTDYWPSMTTRRTVNMPIIDPGLFVIQGVNSCGGGQGYCMLGTNCSLDRDFVQDTAGNCDGLLTAFTPAANFSCCEFNSQSRMTATPRPTPTTTEGTTFDDGLVDSIVNFADEVPDKPTDENSQIVDIVAIITDSTGIVDIVTRPYTGPWPPVEDEDQGAVTLPFAKPGETFAPGSMVGLGQNGVNLAGGDRDGGGTTPARPDEDAFQAGDMPAEQETGSQAPTVPDAMLTTAGTTVPSVVSTTVSPPVTTASAEEPPPASSDTDEAGGAELGPLASVPIMDQDQDYIGDVDYDQHLLPALMPIRPGTKAGGVDAAGGASGDGVDAEGTAAAEDAASVVMDSAEGSGAQTAESTVNEAADVVYLNTIEDELVNVSESNADSASQISTLSSAEKTTQGAESPPSASSVLISSDVSSANTATVDQSFGMGVNISNMGSLSVGSDQEPTCGIMGSSLASLINRYRNQRRPVGGEVTSAVVWCWMAAIMRRTHDPQQPYTFVCSGALVERDLVLTTAGCASRLFQEPLRNFVVLLGASSLRANLDFGVQHMPLEEIIIHEEYTINNDIHANDIGLLKLTEAATLARTVCLLCLPPESMALTGRQSCSVTGYGLPDLSPAAAAYSDDVISPEEAGVLRQTSLPVTPGRQCSTLSRLTQRLPQLDHRSFLCAGENSQSANDACYIARGSGSPLACMAAGRRYYLYGLVSFSGGCRGPQTPRIYTNVATHFSWIRDNYRRMRAKFTVRSNQR